MADYQMTVDLSMRGDLSKKAKENANAFRDMFRAAKELEKLKVSKLVTDLEKSRKAAQGLATDLKKIGAIDVAKPFTNGASTVDRMRKQVENLRGAMDKLNSASSTFNSQMARRGNSWAEREARAMERLIGLQSRASLNYQRMSNMRLPAPSSRRELPPRPPHGGRHFPGGHGGMPTRHRLGEVRRETQEAAGTLGHERALLRAQGHNQQTLDSFERNAANTTRRLQYGTTAEGIKMQAELYGALGDAHHAQENLGTHMQLDSIIRTLNARGVFTRGAVSGHDFTYDAVRAAELAGKTRDVPAYERFMDSILRAAVATRGRVDPRMMHQAFQYSRTAGKMFSDEFIRDRLPMLVQEMGGTQAGTALMTMYNSIAGGAIHRRQLARWDELGLLQPDSVQRNRRGQVTGVRANGVVGAELFGRDPYLWVQQHLVPALRAKGITSEQGIRQATLELSGARNTSNMLATMATMQFQFERFARMTEQIRPLGETFATLREHDPTQNVQAFKNAWEELLGTLASPLIAPAISAMQKISGFARGIAGLFNGSENSPHGPPGSTPGQNGTTGTPGGGPGPGASGGPPTMGADGLLAGGALIATVLAGKKILGSTSGRRLAAAGIGHAVAGMPGAVVGWTLAGAMNGASSAASPIKAPAAGVATRSVMRGAAGAAGRVGLRLLPGVGWVLMASDVAAGINAVGEANEQRYAGVAPGEVHNLRRADRRRANLNMREVFNSDRERQGLPQMAPLQRPDQDLSGQGAQTVGTFQQGAQSKWSEILSWWQGLQLPALNLRPSVTISPNVQTNGLPGGAGERPAPTLPQRQGSLDSGGRSVAMGPTTINVYGNSDPNATAREVARMHSDAMRTSLSDTG